MKRLLLLSFLICFNVSAAGLEIVDENTASYVDTSFNEVTISRSELNAKKNVEDNKLIELKNRRAAVYRRYRQKRNAFEDELQALDYQILQTNEKKAGYEKAIGELDKFKKDKEKIHE